MCRQGIEPRNRAIPGCRRAPNTRKATATTPRRQGVAAPGGVGDPWHARKHCGRDPGGPAPGLGYRTQVSTANPRGTSVMHGDRESDSSIVPMKRPNKVEGRTTMRSREQTEAAEAVEGRELAQGKTGEPTRGRTQRRSALQRARDAVDCALAPCLRGRCFRAVDAMLDEEPKCIAIDKPDVRLLVF